MELRSLATYPGLRAILHLSGPVPAPVPFVRSPWWCKSDAVRLQPTHPPFKENTMSYSEELGKLADLHQRGALSDDDYARAKARVIDGASAAASVDAPPLTALNQVRRSRNDSWIGGVCGGLAKIA